MTPRFARAAVAALVSSMATLAGAIVLFLAAAMAGALLPGVDERADGEPRDVEIVLLSGLLHTDILLPARADVREAFAFARGTQLPIDAEGLRWLSVGWGSRAFYTTAGSYADIAPRAAWRAATGDEAVLRLVGFGALTDGADLRRVRLSEKGFERLLRFVRRSVKRDDDGFRHVPGASLQPGDAFFEAHGRFNLFVTCNEWVRHAMIEAGLGAGAWTPTSFALSRSLRD